ncbi:MAG: hypothetical protein M3Q97_02355, partial [Bacteroidota bacterium]|nr:hypothetical protein [Bacteroidota bacterium]
MKYFTLPEAVCKAYSALCIVLICQFFPSFSFGQTNAREVMPKKAEWGLQQNSGQIPEKEVLYYANHYNGANIYCLPDRIAFTFQHSEPIETTANEGPGSVMLGSKERVITKTRTELLFIGCNPHTVIEEFEEASFVLNYFLAHTPSEGITNVKSFKKLVYRNMYPHIDLVLYTHEQGLKYEFHVNPGGDPTDIKMKWEGGTSVSEAANGGILIKNGLAEITDDAPVTYQADQTFVKSTSILTGGEVRFPISSYDKHQTLIIDPMIRWATYYGGEGADAATDIVTDNNYNFYITGTTTSVLYIATPGTHMDTLADPDWPEGNDIFIQKYDSAGYILWGTYYGGAGKDYPHKMILSSDNKMYIAGETGSSWGIVTPNAADTNWDGGSPGQFYVGDGFLACFDISGTRKWATYVGAHRFDGLQDIASDASGNIYAVGWSNSNTGIATAGAYHATYMGGNFNQPIRGGDCILLKFRGSDGKKLWATYFGGSSDDLGFAVGTDALANVYISGQTKSASGVASASAYKTTLSDLNQYDAFLAKFDSAGKFKWSTYYGGTQFEIVSTLDLDSKANIHFAGTTFSNSGIATSSAFSTALNGITDGYIASFDSSGSILGATYYGGENQDFITSLEVDSRDRLCLTGYTTSRSGLTTGDGEALDSFFAVPGGHIFTARFNSAGQREWGSMRGGDGSDIANGIAVDPDDAIYIAGFSTSTSNLATWVAQNNFPIGGADAFVIRYDTIGYCWGTPVPVITGTVDACQGVPTSYSTAYLYDNTNFWEVTGGTILYGEYEDSLSVRWDSTGKGSLQLIVQSYKGCRDTVGLEVDVKAAKHTINSKSVIACSDHTFTISTNFPDAISHKWYFGDGRTSVSETVSISYSKPGIYKIVVEGMYPSGCASTHTMFVDVVETPRADFAVARQGNSYIFTSVDTTSDVYRWKIMPGQLSFNTKTISHTFLATGVYTVSLTVINPSTGCTSSSDTVINYDPAGLKENAAVNSVQVYPNPSTGDFTVSFDL